MRGPQSPPGRIWGALTPPLRVPVVFWGAALGAIGITPPRSVFGVPPTPPTGPVFVELPIDVLYPFHVVEKEVGGPKSTRGLRGKLIQW